MIRNFPEAMDFPYHGSLFVATCFRGYLIKPLWLADWIKTQCFDHNPFAYQLPSMRKTASLNRCVLTSQKKLDHHWVIAIFSGNLLFLLLWILILNPPTPHIIHAYRPWSIHPLAQDISPIWNLSEGRQVVFLPLQLDKILFNHHWMGSIRWTTMMGNKRIFNCVNPLKSMSNPIFWWIPNILCINRRCRSGHQSSKVAVGFFLLIGWAMKRLYELENLPFSKRCFKKCPFDSSFHVYISQEIPLNRIWNHDYIPWNSIISP